MTHQKTIGIIGAGQLGMMLTEEAHSLGARVITLDPSSNAPATRLSDKHLVAAYDDASALDELCRLCDVVTYEFENVPGEVLIPLVERYHIPQGFQPLYDSQDRLREKTNAQQHGLLTPRFAAADDSDSLQRAIAYVGGYPCVYKTRTLGYDGHGQVVLHSDEDLSKIEPYFGIPGIVEEFIPFDFETSAIVVSNGVQTICFPSTENIHRNGILDLTIIPSERVTSLSDKISAMSIRFMEDCGYQGILAIEYFVRGNQIYFNEMAPRPHNSGHWTIEGCTTNQYRELARYLLEMPLEKPTMKAPTIMKNILGRDLSAAEIIQREHPQHVYVHMYGKQESRPARKMGHITFTETSSEQYYREWAPRFE
jgi:5-(carboxyamino)imidazole ribonucleotide synthase